ncbi:MAG: protein phosphatase 2C domain-containing protein [Oscillospiraceae bacterium]|nr:protein phosphatase 2C domain-containing protein [Oscillospiraceae bacterium]MBQ8979211.1 protein phosphatase 2C domain-containing protein [Oscillospiraceae bacterium]
MFKGFSYSVQGASHVKRDLVCQDASAHIIADRYAAAIAADGHGSKKHFRSNVGSQCAVDAVLETLARYYEDADAFEKEFPDNYRRVIKNIEKQVISVWNNKVNEHLKANPVTDEERSKFTDEEFEAIPPESYYGTTLIAAVCGIDYSFGFQIGDGSLVAVFEDGYAITPTEYDESAPANVTASMCNANASTMFRSFYEKDKKVIALYTSTDGLYTSFGSENDFLDYHVIITSQLKGLPEFADTVLKNITKRSHFGTEDDVSFSCVCVEENVLAYDDLINQRVAENKQKAADRRAALLKK